MRRLDSLPMAELEEMLKTSEDSMLLEQILQQTVLHPVCNEYPPSVKYRRLFLAELIKKHEMTSAEPLDDLYDALGEVLRSEELQMCHKNYFLLSGENIRLGENVAIISEGTTGLVTWEAALFFAEWAMENPEVFNCRLQYGVNLACVAGLKLAEEFNPCPNSLGAPPNFSKPFKVAINASDIGIGAGLHQEDEDGIELPVGYFSKKLNIHQRKYSTIEKEQLSLVLALEHFIARTVLELGSGSGLTGIAICKTCTPKQYIFSDCHSSVLHQLRKNILTNGLLLDSESWSSKDCEVQLENNNGSEENQRPKITVVGLDWSDATQEQVTELQPDVIIATDVVYDPAVFLCLVSILEKFLISAEKQGSSTVVYLASTIRNPETYYQFKMELDKVGIGHQVIPGPTRAVFPYDRCTKIELLKIHHGTEMFADLT